MKRVLEILNKYNVDYSSARDQINLDPIAPPTQPPEGGPQISTDDAYSKSDSWMFILAPYLYDDDGGNPVHQIVTFAFMSLDVPGAAVDDAGPLDALSYTWEGSHFQPLSQDRSNVFHWDNQGPNLDLTNYRDYRPYGVWIDVEDNKHYDSVDNLTSETFQVLLETKVEKLKTNNDYNIGVEYLHTWCGGGACLVNSLSFGPVGVDIDGYFYDSYRLEATVKI